jgi:hypothetical protein
MVPRHVFRWDLDKTYLRSEFESLKDLVKSAMEAADEKRAVPGAPAILRALRASAGAAHRICIVSGSPTQMRKVLEAKLALDKVEWDEFVLKDNLKNLLRGRFRATREQVQYKLPTLLESRVNLGGDAQETLFGDDAESDAIIYSLYADLCAGRVGVDVLEAVLEAASAYPDARLKTLELAARVPKVDVVKRILIHLDKRSATGRFDRYGARLVPVYNYFQAALVLYADGLLSTAEVLEVTREMLASDYGLDALANSLQDLLRRRRLQLEVASRLAAESLALAEDPTRWRGLPAREDVIAAFAARVRTMGEAARAAAGSEHDVDGDGEPHDSPELDYPALVREEHSRKKAGKRARQR